MKNPLRSIQIVFKIAKVLYTIGLVVVLILGAASVAGFLDMATGAGTFYIGGLKIPSPTEIFGADLNTSYFLLGYVFFNVIISAVLTFLTVKYINHELKDGTPFTFDGAKELFRLGVISIILLFIAFISSSVAADSWVGIGLAEVFDAAKSSNVISSIAEGIAMIILAFIFKYGAQLRADKEALEAERKTEDEE